MLPADAIADVRIRVPTRGNRRLEQLLDAVNADPQVKAWWHMAGINAQRLSLTDHSWVHIQIVTNIALRLARLLFRRGVRPAMVVDHGMTERDAEVVIAAGALFHCVGMSIHRTDHEGYSLFLTADRLGGLLARVYDEPERSVVVAEAMHAVISHRSIGRSADRRGRRSSAWPTRSTWPRAARAWSSRPDAWTSTRSPPTRSTRSASRPGDEKAVRVEVEMSNSAGIYQVDEGLGAKLRGTPLAEHIEVIARIEAEHEKRLVPVFRL